MSQLLKILHILTNKSSKDNIIMNKGQSLLKPQDDMDHFETRARHSDFEHCVEISLSSI